MLIGDDTFVAAGPQLVAAAVADPARWAQWWPDLTLTVTRDRGVKGCQWVVAGTFTGTAEIWLEPWHDGTILHLIQRLDPPSDSRSGSRSGARSGARSARAEEKAWTSRVLAWKRHANRLKDELEAADSSG